MVIVAYKHVPVRGDEKFREILESWQGTRYMLGQCKKGQGVDCLRFVVAALTGWRGDLAWHLPRDLSYRTPEEFMTSMRLVLEVFEPWKKVMDTNLESGDVILSKNLQLGYHVHVAGTMQGELWSAERKLGVTRTGYIFTGPVLRVWRPLGKETWTSDS